MSLTAFFDEMRKELTLAEGDFVLWLATMEAGVAAEGFSDAVDGYSSQLMRIGATAEMLGMPGLAAWASTVNQSVENFAALDDARRPAAVTYLGQWPKLVDTYLAAPGDFAASAALAEYLANPVAPEPLADDATLPIMEALALPPVVPEELLAELAVSDAPAQAQIEDVSLLLADDSDPEVYHAFLDEAVGNVGAFSKLTDKIAHGLATADDIKTAKRLAHSFKGSANIVGIRGIASLGHHTEDILEYFENHPVKPPRALGHALVEASDCLGQMVGHLRGEEEAPEFSFQILSEIVSWANKVKTGDVAEDDNVPQAPALASNSATGAGFEPVAASFSAAAATSAVEAEASLRVSVRTIDELFRLVGELTTKVGRLETRVKSANQYAKSMLTQNLVVQARVLELDKLVVLRGLSLTRTASDEGESESEFDPLEMDRYNELHGVTRALVEVTEDAREMASAIESEISQVATEVQQQRAVTKDLQHQVVSTRMTPVSVLSGRLNRNVRQTCQQTGKEAELVLIGGEINVDGDVLNRLADPLLHILRNAVDHGIEMPEVRRAGGKPIIGKIALTFARQGATVRVTIKDDGRGLDYERIREKATLRGLIDGNSQLGHADLARLTLLPGFSTREHVSEVSGRGVGMDVVASRLAELKGSVEILSVPGDGCEIILKFQASLVTQHALLVEAARQKFSIPSHNVEQAVPGALGEVDQVEGALWFSYREHRYALLDLAALTGYPAEASSAQQFAALPKVLMSTGGRLVAVAVNKVVDSRELIVKSMGKYLRRVHGISGASVLGDGTVVPLLNLPELVATPVAQSAAAARLAAEARQQSKRVLVVDDSLSVRKSLTQLFEDAAYEVRGAGDGLDAIRILDEFNPHMVCTDLEMPNMNGLEFTQHIRHHAVWSTLPIIMITSRSMDKHRDQAMLAGVDYYVTKPYADADLMAKAREAIARSKTKDINVTA